MSSRQNTQFAVASHVLIYLAGAGRGRVVSSDELAGSVNVNPVHIRRVLGPLRDAGLVRSRPGARGGWELARAATDIRLDEVWDLVNADESVLPSHGPSPQCPVGRHVQDVLDEVGDGVAAAIRRELHGRSVADVAGVATDSRSAVTN